MTVALTHVKGHYALNLLRRPWTRADRWWAARFPARKATVLPSVWVEELMAKRFGAIGVCQPCAWKYSDGLKRWGYAKHPDMKFSGNPCDFCKQVYDLIPIWLKEEHRYPTRQQYYDESQRAGVMTRDHHLYDSRRRSACTL